MFHPGHDHIPVRSECHTAAPGMTELRLFTSDLEDAGVRTNEYGDLLRSSRDDRAARGRGLTGQVGDQLRVPRFPGA